MKTLFASFLLATTALVATAADAPTVSGKWKIHISIAGREADANCTLNQTGEDLTGVCEGPNGTFNLAGKVADKKINWSYKTSFEAGTITLHYRGAINSPTSISGFVNVEEFGVDGEFTATQAS